MKKYLCFGLLVSLAGTVCAQEYPKFAFDAGAGFTTPVLATGSNIDTGWNVRAGVGYNFAPWVGVLTDFGYDNMGINSSTLGNLAYNGGNLRVFSATLDPIIHFTPLHHVDMYVTGGGGYFREEFDYSTGMTSTGIGVPGTYGMPTFGFYPNAYGATMMPNGYSINKPGLDGGVGVELGSKWGGKFFAEARFVRIFSGSYHTDYIPVTFGFRR